MTILKKTVVFIFFIIIIFLTFFFYYIFNEHYEDVTKNNQFKTISNKKFKILVDAFLFEWGDTKKAGLVDLPIMSFFPKNIQEYEKNPDAWNELAKKNKFLSKGLGVLKKNSFFIVEKIFILNKPISGIYLEIWVKINGYDQLFEASHLLNNSWEVIWNKEFPSFKKNLVTEVPEDT